MKNRNGMKELEYVGAGDLKPHPKAQTFARTRFAFRVLWVRPFSGRDGHEATPPREGTLGAATVTSAGSHGLSRVDRRLDAGAAGTALCGAEHGGAVLRRADPSGRVA
jgi:hypothetical protein